MAIAMNVCDTFREKLFDGTNTVDLEYSATPTGAHLRLLLATAASFSINQNTATTLSDVTYTQVSGTGYPSNGFSLANAGVTKDGSGNISVDADDPATVSADAGGFTAGRRFLLAYDNGGAVGTWPVVAYSDDAGADISNVAADVTIAFNANGLIRSTR